MTGSGVEWSSDNPTSSVFLRGLKGNDRAAWERLLDLYGRMVYRWCRLQGLQRADALDVGQDVFWAVARGIAAFRRDRPGDTFRGWLYAITVNKVRDFERYRRRHRSLQPGSCWEAGLPAPKDPSSSEQLSPPAECRLLCQRVLDRIRPEFRERTWKAFWATAVEDRPVREVATEIGLSPNAVMLAKARVLRRLRNEVGGLIEGVPP